MWTDCELQTAGLSGSLIQNTKCFCRQDTMLFITADTLQRYIRMQI